MYESKVSIVIPTFNAGETIVRCLRSIRNQSYSHVEIIVVDNFSNDTTMNTAKSFGARALQQRSTPASARNTGVVNATGKYVFFVDSDQVLSRSVVQECVTECEEKNAGMVRVPELFIGEGFWGSCSAEWKNYYGKVERRYGGQHKILSGEPRFFVKEQLIHVGMFDPSMLWGEDYDLYQRLKERKVKEVSCKSTLFHYEPASVKGIMNRNLRYGESMPTFIRHSDKKVFSRVVRHSLLAWRESLSDLTEKPDITFGCTILFGMKAFAMITGLLANLA